jgi:hypothetical protein
MCYIMVSQKDFQSVNLFNKWYILEPRDGGVGANMNKVFRSIDKGVRCGYERARVPRKRSKCL